MYILQSLIYKSCKRTVLKRGESDLKRGLPPVKDVCTTWRTLGTGLYPGAHVACLAQPGPEIAEVKCARPETGHPFSFHSFAANGNTGPSGQAQWLPVAVTTRDCAPKSPTAPSGHATTRVKQVSAPKGPAHLYSCQLYSNKGRRQHKYCDAGDCPC